MCKFVGKQDFGRSWLSCTLLQFFSSSQSQSVSTLPQLARARKRCKLCKRNLGIGSQHSAFFFFLMLELKCCIKWKPACKTETNFLPTAFDTRFVKSSSFWRKMQSWLSVGSGAEAEGRALPGSQRPNSSKLFFCKEKLCLHTLLHISLVVFISEKILTFFKNKFSYFRQELFTL